MNFKILTTPEAARELGVTEQRIRQLAAAGEIKAEKWGRDWMVDTESKDGSLGLLLQSNKWAILYSRSRARPPGGGDKNDKDYS